MALSSFFSQPFYSLADFDSLFDEAFNARSQGSSALTTREGNNTAARPLRPRYVLSLLTSTFEDDADSGATGWTSMRTRTRTL